MFQNKIVFVVLFICFRLFTAFLINGDRSFYGAFHLLPEYNTSEALRQRLPIPRGGDVPDYFDWRSHDGVTPVKDQNRCGACWAFTTLANIESQLKIHGRGEVILSEQFLIDCNSIKAGCSGASIIKSFADIITDIGGVLEQSQYPSYENAQGKCRWNKDAKELLAVIGFMRVKPDEDEMVQSLFHYGPLSAAINSNAMKKYFHNKTIDQPSKEACSPDPESQDHAVLIVGYNTYISPDGKVKVPYWIIKNSWGTDWGDDGYYYLERGTNACGIANDVSFSLVPHPKQILRT